MYALLHPPRILVAVLGSLIGGALLLGASKAWAQHHGGHHVPFRHHTGHHVPFRHHGHHGHHLRHRLHPHHGHGGHPGFHFSFGAGRHRLGHPSHGWSFSPRRGFRGPSFSPRLNPDRDFSTDLAAPQRVDQNSLGDLAGPDRFEGGSGAAPDRSPSQAWELLAANRPSEALDRFGSQASSNPTEGIPKIGYALSAAAAGDLETGVWAMRRACRIDPQSVRQLVAGELPSGVRGQAKQLIEDYETVAAQNPENEDVAFMLASLHALLGHEEAAADAVQVASDLGDEAPSTQNLQLVLASLDGEGPTEEEPARGTAQRTTVPPRPPEPTPSSPEPPVPPQQ